MDRVPQAEVEFLIQNLGDFIRSSNYELISGAEESFSKLKDELEILKGFLEQFGNKSSSILDSLANKVRNLVHQAEDAIETFIIEDAKHKLRGSIRQLFHESEYKLRVRNLASEVEQISKEIKEFLQTKAPLGLEAMKYASEALSGFEYERREQEPLFDDCVIGLEDETEKVIGLLTKGTEQLDVISIVGMPGLGKTSLAKKVFNDPKIENQFFIRSFVEVSQGFNRNHVFLKILNSLALATEDNRKLPDDGLANIIMENLQKRSYLIVLDDVWTTDAWDQLKSAFPDNGKSSRVLITTRNKDVADHARRISEPHLLRFLYPDESRELLRLKVFEDPTFCLPDELEESEELILRRCEGLPQATVAVAGLLRNNRTDALWWKQTADSVKHYDPKVPELTHNLIKLSFDSLPSALKPCFLYLGVFPTGFEISARTLLRLWVSEGFVAVSDESLSLEDIAAFYLQNLVDRSLVIVQKGSSNGQVKTIRISTPIHEFCKAHARQENLYHEIKGPNMSSTDNDRRLCINSHLPDYVSSKPSGKRVRSFLSFAQDELVLPLDQISSILRTFKLLRLLHIRSIKLTRLPPDLYYLVLLKYIAIYGDLTVLPEKMSNLWNLQTLAVYTSRPRSILDVKADIWRMGQLRHLETNASAILLEPKEGSPSNENLQTLSTISPESCTKGLFERTPKLRKLGISGKLTIILEDRGSIWSSSLSKLEKLENLKLLNTQEKISKLPSCDLFPRKLAKLTLLNTLLDWKHMTTIGKLDNLEVLKLKNDAFEGPIWNTEDGGFRRLRVLHIGKTDLSVWKASSSNFPVLASLHIRHCSDLLGIPEGLQDIPTLQMIDLYNTNELLVHSARRFQGVKLHSTDNNFKLFVYPPDN